MSNSTGTPRDARHRGVGKLHAFVGIVVAVVLSILGVGVVANAADQVAISITSTLSPSNVTIRVGTTVTWTNNDSQQHELRSESGPVEFRTDTLDPGQSASMTFDTAGTYTYLDHQNQDSAAYNGTIVVTDAAVPAPPPGNGATPPAVTPAAPTTASVRLAGGRFSPATVTVAAGGTVTWLNDDGSKHTVTADNATFDSGTLNAGATFAHTFTTAGSFTYICDFHSDMRGTVLVPTATGTVPPPAAPAPVTPPPPPAPPAAPVTPATPVSGATSESVAITNNLFSPSSITVTAGSTVTWTNNDTVTHTVTADDQSFTSGLMKKTASWSKTFATPGTFPYFCDIHPEMTGTVIAKAADGTVPAAAPTVPNNPVAAVDITNAAADPGSAAGAATGTIAINDTGFNPASFRVAVGGTLTFVNKGKAMHTVTAGNGSFDSGMIKSAGTWVHTFTTAGSFAYTCILHPNMRGTIEVGSSARGQAIESAALTPASGAVEGDSAPTTAAVGADGTAIPPVSVDVADNEFRPDPAIVGLGGTVTWNLVGAAAHTVTADDQTFNSGLLKAGESYAFTFTTLGSFAYTCLVHPGMVGTVEVVPPDQAAVLQPAPSEGGSSQAQQAPDQPATIAATGPAKNTGLWGETLLGIAAVLVACCALVLALKSFLKVLGSNDPVPEMSVLPTDALRATPM